MSEDKTVKQLIDRALEGVRVNSDSITNGDGTRAGLRELALATTKLEEAQMWFTRGLAMNQGLFKPADLEKSCVQELQ
jgi:hypothetical protein